jgi:N-formylmaleamate deformylase
LFVVTDLLTLFVVVPYPEADDLKSPAESYPFAVTVRGEGPPMILIPGLACAGAVWNDTVKRFEKQFQRHVLTLAGFAGEPARPGPFLDAVRDGILRYIRNKKLVRPVIIGHSLGGFLAYELGIVAPEVVGPLIAVKDSRRRTCKRRKRSWQDWHESPHAKTFI